VKEESHIPWFHHVGIGVQAVAALHLCLVLGSGEDDDRNTLARPIVLHLPLRLRAHSYF
jgi:hypothetical protein